MRIHFDYNKQQVLQALRYHFISRAEIRIMLIMVNVFAIFSIVLYALHKVTPTAFLVGSGLWLVLMISFWFVMPALVYKRAETFRNSFAMDFKEEEFSVEHERGARAFDYKKLTYYMESPHFFHLYFDARSFFLVPKSGFTNKEEISEMRSFLKDRVKKR